MRSSIRSGVLNEPTLVEVHSYLKTVYVPRRKTKSIGANKVSGDVPKDCKYFVRCTMAERKFYGAFPANSS